MRNRPHHPPAHAVLLVCLLVAVLVGGSAAASADPVPEGVWPLVPRPAVVTEFDPPDSPWGSGHRGVDLAGSPGQVVVSALPGRVTFASVLAGKSVVVVNHGATRTTYEPVVATVGVGDVVAAGQPIGRLETPHSHCLPSACLHWGLIRNVDDVYLDPLSLVGARRVRLLPFDGLGRGTPAHTVAPPVRGVLGLLRPALGTR